MKVGDRRDASDVYAAEEWLALREASGCAEGLLVEVVLQPQVEAGGSPARAEEPAVTVPREAWEKMLEQLGALHEAGRRLTEATERVVRAEKRYALEVEGRKLLEDRVAQLEKVTLVVPIDGGTMTGPPVREVDAEAHGVVGGDPAVPPLPDEEPEPRSSNPAVALEPAPQTLAPVSQVDDEIDGISGRVAVWRTRGRGALDRLEQLVRDAAAEIDDGRL